MIAAAALAAALAVVLLVPPSGTRLDPRSAWPIPAWLAGNPNAPALTHRAALGAVAGALAAQVAGGWPGVALAAVVALSAVVGLGRIGPRSDPKAARRELPDALDFLAACLDVGLPLSRAVAVVTEISPPETARLLAVVDAALASGRAPDEAWGLVEDHAVWGRVSSDIASSERRGTSLVGLLRAHADDARQDAAEETLKRARTVGVRSVLPLMVCFLPAFVLVGIVPIVAGLLTDLLG